MKRILVFLLFYIVAIPNLPAQAACVFNAAGTEAEAASGSITLNAPASPAVNDIWIAAVNSNDDETHVLTDWTQIREATSAYGNIATSIWYFRYAGSTPNLIVTTTSTDLVVGGIIQLRGCDTVGSPVDVLGTLTETSNNTTSTILGVTPSTSNTLLIAITSWSDDVTIVTPPSGFDLRLDSTSTTAGDASIMFWTKSHVSGATGNFSVVSNNATAESHTTLMAIAELVSTTRRRSAPKVMQ